MLELFRVAGRLVLDKSGYDEDVKHADESGKNLAENLTSYMEKAKKVIAGLFAFAAVKKAATSVWNLAKETSAAGDRIDKNSQKLGLSRKAYQEWDYILRQSGADIDSLGGAMRYMNRTLTENSADTAAALSQLGLSAAELQSLSPEEQFELIVRRLQEMPEGAEKSRLAVQLLGRGAQQLMPLLNSSADSVEELRQRAHSLGLVMSDEDVDASVAFGDALDDLNAVWSALKQKFGAQLLPGFTRGLIGAANALGRITTALEKAFKEGDWKGFFGAITEEISNALPAVMDTVLGVIGGIFDNADKIIDLAVSIVTGLADGLVKAMPKLIAKLPTIVKSLFDGLKKLFASASDLLKIVFGETADGGIKWPSPQEMWEKIKSGLATLWAGIQSAATSILKFIFGESEDGGINWPDPAELWQKISAGLSALWSGIKTLATGILKFVFGESADGGIEWPSVTELWNKISTGFSMLWDGGDGKGGIRALLQDAAKWVLGLFGLPKETTDQIVTFFGNWWSAVKDAIETAASWVLSLFGFVDDSEVKEHFRKWWEGEDGTGGVKAMIKQIANWVLGALNLPSVEEIRAQIRAWWQKVKSGLSLFVNAEWDPNWNPGSSVTPDQAQSWLDDPDSWIYDQHAKGLNYVPYDGYRASLHRGEVVLNQAQGRAWRQGQASGGINAQQLYSAVSEAVAAAISGISVNMDGRVVGNLVADQVSRNIYMNQLGRRFNTV